MVSVWNDCWQERDLLRKVGDESLLEDNHDFGAGPDTLGPYPKMNWDGKKLKSITSVLRDKRGKAHGLLCINLDVSGFDQLKKLAALFLGDTLLQEQPAPLFEDDWREKINVFVQKYLQENQKTISNLSQSEKSKVVVLLHRQGAFKGKNAASYVGDVLGISRATVYKYLNDRNDQNASSVRSKKRSIRK